MSRIAKNSIKIPEGTSYTYDKNILTVKGKLGEVSLPINDLFTIKNNSNEIYILPKSDRDKSNPMWGTTRAHVANLFTGVNQGFWKTLVFFELSYM